MGERYSFSNDVPAAFKMLFKVPFSIAYKIASLAFQSFL
jgi:hypothetical protein